VRFTSHSPGTVGAIKIDWVAPVARDAAVRAAMAPHDVDAMRAGVVIRGFAIGAVTYPRGTLAFRVADGHELFLQLPGEPAPVARPPVIASAWVVAPEGELERHRGTVGSQDADERVDIVIATRAPGISRAQAQRLLDDGKVRVAGRAVRKNHRVQPGDLIEVERAAPPLPDAVS
jgi:hypothetical protein